MSRQCEVCGKKPQFGHNVSHAHNITNRRWNPNLQPVRALVNGEMRQQGNTADMIFQPAKLISFISSVMTLLPGDVILTGTPPGVGPLAGYIERLLQNGDGSRPARLAALALYARAASLFAG